MLSQEKVGEEPDGVLKEQANLQEVSVPALPLHDQKHKVQIVCQKHKLPYVQIEIQTQRPVCEECIVQMGNLDIECERVKATNQFRQFVEEFRRENEQLEKMKNLFKPTGIIDVRRKIKNGLPQIQQIIEQELSRLIEDGNKELQQMIESQLVMWSFLDQEVISQPETLPLMLQYKSIFAQHKNRVNEKKQEIKRRIADQLKKITRKHYTEQFGLQ